MPGKRKQEMGTVLESQMAKTALVRVEWLERELQFGKVVRRRRDYKVHDPQQECRIGDRVMIEETRPLSRDKCWRLLKMVERAVQQIESPEAVSPS